MEELLQLFHDVKQRGAWEAKYKVGKKKIQILQQTEEPDSADEHDSLTMTNVVLFTFPGKLMVSGREFLDRRVAIRCCVLNHHGAYMLQPFRWTHLLRLPSFFAVIFINLENVTQFPQLPHFPLF